MPPAVIICAACQTKLKVPDSTSAKALRCPKCKGVVPLKAEPNANSVAATPAPAEPLAPPTKEEEEFEVNEAVEEEFEVNEAADEEEEFEVDEAVDEEDDSNADEEAPSSLAELGFANVKDPYKKGKVPDDAKKAIEKTFVKNEKVLWTGRPSVKVIESKAWIGLVVGPLLMLLGCGLCSGLSLIPMETWAMKLIPVGVGVIFGLMFGGVGVAALLFRKSIGGSVQACYVVSNKRAYIYDISTKQLRAFTPQQLADMGCSESSKFDDCGDLVFANEMNDAEGVMLGKERAQDIHGGTTAVGFLNIENLHAVRTMMHEVLIDPGLKRAKKKKKKQTRKYFS